MNVNTEHTTATIMLCVEILEVALNVIARLDTVAMVRHAVMLMNVRVEWIIVTTMPYAPNNTDHLVINIILVIPVMVSLALMTTNALKEATIVLVIVDYAQIFQVQLFTQNWIKWKWLILY